MSDSDPRKHDDAPGMEINLDRPRRVRTTIIYWMVVLAVAGLLAALMARFTGSILVAVLLSGGMLAYMLIAAAITSKNLERHPGDGRLD